MAQGVDPTTRERHIKKLRYRNSCWYTLRADANYIRARLGVWTLAVIIILVLVLLLTFEARTNWGRLAEVFANGDCKVTPYVIDRPAAVVVRRGVPPVETTDHVASRKKGSKKSRPKQKDIPTVVFSHVDDEAGASHPLRERLRLVSRPQKLHTVRCDRDTRKSIIERMEMGETFDLAYGSAAFDLCQYSKHRSCTYFTVLRDPIDRLVADYGYFCINGKHHRRFWRFGWRQCQVDIIEWASYDRNNPFVMSLTHDMAEVDQPKGYCNDPSDAKAAIKNLDTHFSLVMLSSHLDAGVNLLTKVYGDAFVVSDQPSKQNVIENDTFTRDMLTDADLLHLGSILTNDFEVYFHACRRYFHLVLEHAIMDKEEAELQMKEVLEPYLRLLIGNRNDCELLSSPFCQILGDFFKVVYPIEIALDERKGDATLP
eukprot:TRINITY_DN6426_c0_g1_i2.p1 TRINITY_DN6426_c0_g1~~TRINITY_DN6426_c0_g1_i2.p1  ORF type:complete len:428 (+),score=66.36 TRINITY_DN6426_c0_g1_i2:319-1602(+)